MSRVLVLKAHRIWLTVRERVRAAFMTIVKAGVVHEDLTWDHVLCRNNEVRIIDFNQVAIYDANIWTPKEFEEYGQDLEAPVL